MYYILHPFFRGGTTPGPQARPNTCAHPRAPLTGLHTFQVRTGDSRGCRRRCLALSVRAHRERSNGTILEFASLRLGFRLSWRRLKTRCRRPKPATLCPGRGTADPSCTPSRVLRAAQKHPRIASLAPTQPGRYQFPAPSTRVPSGRPVALTWLVHTVQVSADDFRGARRPSLARSLRARRCRLNGAMHEFDCCRVSSRAAVCRGV